MSSIPTDKVILQVGPVNTLVSFPPELPSFHRQQLLEQLKFKLRARPSGYRFSPKYKLGVWDGYIHFVKNNTFPSGLLPYALEVFERNAEEFEYIVVVRQHKPPVLPLDMLKPNYLYNFRMRDYQIEAAKEMIKAGRAVAKIATNGGKTLIIAAISKLCNSNTLIMTHKTELMYQTAEYVQKATGIRVGLIGDGKQDYSKQVTVAMVQTLHSRLDTVECKDFLDHISCLIIDEAHHTSGKIMYETVMSIPATWRFGFSGTPLKHNDLNDLQLIAATGEIVIEVTNEDLIEKGYSAKPVITIYEVTDNRLAPDALYQTAYQELIVKNSLRNQLIITEAIAAAKSDQVVLILVERVEHQEELRQVAKQSQYGNFVIMNGSQSSEYRSKKLNNMRAGKAGIYCATTQLLGEGVSVDEIGLLIIAGGGKSHIKVLQQVGRGLRRKEGDNTVRIIDFIDIGSKHLSKHSAARIKIYKQEGFELVMKELVT